MTQNTEQKVRTREDLEQELAILICKARGRDPFQMTYHTVEPGVMEPFGDAWCHYIAEAQAVLEWHEAEARGAEEQRRKGADGQEPVGYVSNGSLEHLASGKGMRVQNLYGYPDNAWPVPLYTHPANVAALEDRVKELEVENNHQRTQILELRNDDRRIRLAAERVCSVRESSEIFHARIALRAALKREGGV